MSTHLDVNIEAFNSALKNKGWSVTVCSITKTIALTDDASGLLIGFFPTDIPVRIFAAFEDTSQVNEKLIDTGWSISEVEEDGKLVWCLWDKDDQFIQIMPIGIPSKTIRERVLKGLPVFQQKISSDWTDGEHWEALGISGYSVSLLQMVVSKD